jgi:nucleotide-binding universal stress UspA family protein
MGVTGQNDDIIAKLRKPGDVESSAATLEPSGSWVVARNITFGCILVPIDYSAGARRALRTALALQELMGSEVHLFHVAEEGADDQFIESIGGSSTTQRDLVVDSKERLIRFVENVCPDNASDVSVHALAGVEVVDGIDRMAKEVGATLVLFSRRASDSLFRTSAERVARVVDGAVLLL